jgi:hypothetical protein
MTTLALGAISGLLWWGVSLVFGARSYGIVGTHPSTGVLAGVGVGLAVAVLSIPIYRRLSARHILWWSPVSVYIAIAAYGALLFAIRLARQDFVPGATPWAVGAESVFGMWWGVTFSTPVALPVHLLAYGNHRLLRRIGRSEAHSV